MVSIVFKYASIIYVVKITIFRGNRNGLSSVWNLLQYTSRYAIELQFIFYRIKDKIILLLVRVRNTHFSAKIALCFFFSYVSNLQCTK